MSTHPPPSLAGKRAIVTGGTTGVGRATAALLAASGCRVFICGRDPGHLADALEAIRRDGGAAQGIPADLASSDEIQRFFAAADGWLGGLDIVVLNAGIGAHGELTTMSHDECRAVIDVNLNAVIGGALEACRRMEKAGGGHIVMTGSMSAQVFEENAAVYVATKSGVRGFATSLRKEANLHGIKVSLIEPGSISSDMVDETPAQQRQMIAEGRMLSADDVARAVHYLLTQPAGCDVVQLQLRPHLQRI